MKTAQTGLHIKADGTETVVVPYDGKEFTLRELQLFVGGFIEICYTKDNHRMFVNEEGKQKNLPYNGKASHLYQYGEVNPIVGDVLVLTKG